MVDVGRTLPLAAGQSASETKCHHRCLTSFTSDVSPVSPVMTQLWMSSLAGQHRRRWVGYFDDSYLQQSRVNDSGLWSLWKKCKM